MKHLSIVVADDLEEIQSLVYHWLDSAGHSVACVSNGNEVASILKRQAFDLVITDVIMPDGDGIEVISELKKKQPRPRILAISGGGNYLRANDCLNLAKGLGADGVLMKPFNRQQLLAAVENTTASLAEQT
jgi:CheY-like chemotaxis protein